MSEDMPEKEKIPLMFIYKHDGQIKTELGNDHNLYELFGFLKCYMRLLERELTEAIDYRTDNDKELI